MVPRNDDNFHTSMFKIMTNNLWSLFRLLMYFILCLSLGDFTSHIYIYIYIYGCTVRIRLLLFQVKTHIHTHMQQKSNNKKLSFYF